MPRKKLLFSFIHICYRNNLLIPLSELEKLSKFASSSTSKYFHGCSGNNFLIETSIHKTYSLKS